METFLYCRNSLVKIFQNALVNVLKVCWNDIQTGKKEVCLQRQFAVQHPEKLKYLPKKSMYFVSL
jgi:hypothetical protein